MKRILIGVKKWGAEISDYRYHFVLALFFFGIASLIDFLASDYVEMRGTAVASDLILNVIGPLDWSIVYTYGFIITSALVFLYPLFFDVKIFHVAVSHMSLLVIVRSIFLPMTHLKAPLQQVGAEFPSVVSHFSFTNDLFFSGHVAVPFMAFLLFKGSKIRYAFLFLTALVAITVLIMHRHYSIDVFAGLFIAFGTYKMGEWFSSKIEHRNPI